MIPIVGAALPIGEHWWTAGPSGIWQVHMDTVLMTLVAGAVLLLLGLVIKSRVTAGAPGRTQNAVESIMEFINTIIEDNLGRDPETIASIALTLFFFIWVMNTLGLLPIPYFRSPTSDVSTTFALAILVFVLMNARYFRTSRLQAYKGHYWIKGVWGIPLKPLSIVLALETELSRPLTLSLRLFGNILGGEVLLIIAGALLPLSYAVAANIILNPLLIFFGLFVGSIQAFIFTVLTVAYMSIASEAPDAH